MTKKFQPEHKFVSDKQEFDLEVKVKGHGYVTQSLGDLQTCKISKAYIERQKTDIVITIGRPPLLEAAT